MTSETSTYRVALDATDCCASGMCASIAPTAFQVDRNGYAIVLETASSTAADTLLRAAKNCPTLCISIYRDDAEIDLFA
jgi:ferredoxin